MLPGATSCIQDTLHAVLVEQPHKKGQLVGQAPFPGNEAIVIRC
jgi:hypothetical protein